MENKNITITISGKCATFKSRTLYLLKLFLRGYGIRVIHDPMPDHKTEEEFRKINIKNLEDVVEKMKDTLIVTFKEEITE
jgi:hypothetical protein